MNKVDLFALRRVGKAIKAIDKISARENSVGTQENVTRLDEARKNLVNVIFSNGYELQWKTYRVVKSKENRDLV